MIKMPKFNDAKCNAKNVQMMMKILLNRRTDAIENSQYEGATLKVGC